MAHMSEGIARRRLFLWIGATYIGASSGSAYGQKRGTNVDRAGVANFVSGDATLWENDSKLALTSGSVVKQGQIIETGPLSEVHIALDDGGFLALRPSSRIQLDHVQISGQFNDSISMTLVRGALRSITGWIGKFDNHNYQLKTSTATIGIRGTDHEVAIIAPGEERGGEIAGVHNWVNEGGTSLTTAGGHIEIEPGHAAWASPSGSAPQLHQGIPIYLQKRKTKNEKRIDRHAQHVTEHIERRMLKRGMIKPGETLQDAQQRHRAQDLNADSGKRQTEDEKEKRERKAGTRGLRHIRK